MSEDFIPLNQSTPIRTWQEDKKQRGFHSDRFHRGKRRGGFNHSHRGNNSRNNSCRSDSNSSFAQGTEFDVNAYLHPSMLQDPWASLRQKNNQPK